MGAQIVKGKVIAQSVYEELAAETPDLIHQNRPTARSGEHLCGL